MTLFMCKPGSGNIKNLLTVKYLLIALLSVLILHEFELSAQGCSSMNIQFRADIPSTCNKMTMTMIHDANDSPYLYVANKEAGMRVYRISDLSNPVLVATVNPDLLDSLDVMNLHQSGSYLYLALGNSFTNPQQAGMAIVDISSPTSPVVKDIYRIAGSQSGAGIVKTEGNYAYLGAMQSGLWIFDVSNPSDITYVSSFVPSIDFPPVNNPNPDLYNARGMEIKNSIVYLCYDAGGIRIINCSNKTLPFESGRWCNPVMYQPFNRPKAYNNLILDDTLLYVSADYCGLEVLNISDTANIKLKGWWNPYNCPGNNWFSSPVHSNEIHYDKDCKLIFLSTGKSDMMVVDVSNPENPDSCNFYGGSSNSIGTWGAGLYKNQIYLSYICALLPFSSNWTGVKILTYNRCNSSVNDINENEINAYPNPAYDQIFFEFKTSFTDPDISIYNCGAKILNTEYLISDKGISLDCSSLSDGIYMVVIAENDKIYRKIFSVQHP